jgi:RING-box protein 1
MDATSAAVPMEEVTGEESGAGASASEKPRKRFEVKKWNAVALWAWGKLE